MISNADKNRALGWEFLAGGGLGLGKRFSEVVCHPHYFACRLHFRTEHCVHSGKLIPWEDWGLDVVAAPRIELGAALDKPRQKLAKLAPSHKPSRDLCHRDAGSLGYEGHGSRSPRIHLEDVHLVTITVTCARDCELDVHQPNHFQCARQAESVVTHSGE